MPIVLRSANYGGSGRRCAAGAAAAQRASAKDRLGLVKKVCRFLEEVGLLLKASDDDEGTWRATPRMRLVARSIVEDSDLFRALLEAVRDEPAKEIVADEPTDHVDDAGDMPTKIATLAPTETR